MKTRQSISYLSAVILTLALITSCSAYKQSVMFNIDSEDYQQLNTMLDEVKTEYVIQAHDQLGITVYTNKGEQLIDPNNAFEVEPEVSQDPLYTVASDGRVNLPILGNVELGGLSLSEANVKLVELYEVYYKSPFVMTRYANKRVIVLGASLQKVVPLLFDGMNLLEVLALAGGVNETGNGSNIRLIRGDLTNPQVAVIDLSTIEGMKKANLSVLPNDIVYIEPVKRPLAGFRDIAPVLGTITSVLALIVALIR